MLPPLPLLTHCIASRQEAAHIYVHGTDRQNMARGLFLS